jgi:hypothetical protein
MVTNIEIYKQDLERLIAEGEVLDIAMRHECFPDQVHKSLGKDADKLVEVLPRFSDAYQSWYSEAKALIRQLLPDRLADFVRHYEKPKPRKEITYENYRVEDYLQGLNVTFGYEKKKVVGPDAAIPHFGQQLAIVKAVSKRFESTIFDIQQLVQADLFDSELDQARELLKNGFSRAAGAIAGVVLERHLGQVCENHQVKLRKKNPGIADYNDALKQGNVVDVPTWRFIQHLGDIRNLCDHNKSAEPKNDQVTDLITGVAKITKTIF